MGKIIAEITDSRFNRKLTNLYKLSVHIGADSLICFVVDSLKRPLVLRHWQFEAGEADAHRKILATAVSRDPFLRATYGETRVALDNERLAVVPAALFQPGEEAAFLYKLTSPAPEDELHSYLCTGLRVQAVYALSKRLRPLLREYFPLASVHHLGTAFLVAAHQHSIAQAGAPFVLAELQYRALRVAAMQDGRLLFFNTFHVRHARDVLYFTLLAYREAELDPLQVPLWISGQVLEESDALRQLRRYVRQIHWTGVPAFLARNEALEQLPAWFYFSLFHLHLLD